MKGNPLKDASPPKKDGRKYYRGYNFDRNDGAGMAKEGSWINSLIGNIFGRGRKNLMPKTLTKPAWSRNPGSGYGVRTLSSWKMNIEEDDGRKVTVMVLLYVVTNFIVFFFLPTGIMIGWIILNVGVGSISLWYLKEEDMDEHDASLMTFYENIGNHRVSVPAEYEDSKAGISKKVPQKETYSLSYEYKNQEKVREDSEKNHRGRRAITFSDDEDDIYEKNQIKPIQIPSGKICFDDSVDLSDGFLETNDAQENDVIGEANAEIRSDEQKLMLEHCCMLLALSVMSPSFWRADQTLL